MATNDPDTSARTNQGREWQMGPFQVSAEDRQLSVILGAVLALVGVALRSVSGTMLAMVGSVLLYRGVTAGETLYEENQGDTATWRPNRHGGSVDPELHAAKPDRTDQVEEASWESFPASDSPSWSGGAIT